MPSPQPFLRWLIVGAAAVLAAVTGASSSLAQPAPRDWRFFYSNAYSITVMDARSFKRAGPTVQVRLGKITPGNGDYVFSESTVEATCDGARQAREGEFRMSLLNSGRFLSQDAEMSGWKKDDSGFVEAVCAGPANLRPISDLPAEARRTLRTLPAP